MNISNVSNSGTKFKRRHYLNLKMFRATQLLRIGMRNSNLISRRYFAEEACKPSKTWLRLKENQERFCKDDGRPIYIKCSTRDEILYRLTMGLLAIGTVLSLYYIFANFVLPHS